MFFGYAKNVSYKHKYGVSHYLCEQDKNVE